MEEISNSRAKKLDFGQTSEILFYLGFCQQMKHFFFNLKITSESLLENNPSKDHPEEPVVIDSCKFFFKTSLFALLCQKRKTCFCDFSQDKNFPFQRCSKKYFNENLRGMLQTIPFN